MTARGDRPGAPPGRVRRPGLGRDARGGVAILSALFLAVAIGASALVVDLGHLWLAKRQTQASADLAAIAAVRAPASGQAAAEATVRGNGLAPDAEVQLEWGVYTPDPALAPAERFVPSGSANPADAARVTVRRPVSLLFGRIFDASGSVELVAQGTAARRDEAGISIGSSLASLEGGVLNTLLSALTGSTISLSAAHYDALLGTRIDLLGVLDALNTRAALQAATYDEVLDADITVGELVAAAAAASSLAEQSAALSLLAGQIAGTLDLRLASIIDLGSFGRLVPDGGASGLQVGAFDLVRATLEAANGDSQLALDFGGGIPGLAGVTIDLAIGERPQGLPWLSVGDAGATVRTAQMRMNIEVELLGTSGLLLGVGIRLPLYVEVAAAEARVDAVTCDVTQQGSIRVDVAARTGITEAWIGDIDSGAMHPFTTHPQVQPAELAKVSILGLLLPVEVTIDASAHAVLGDQGERMVVLTEPGDIQTIVSHGMTGSLLSSLLGNLTLAPTVKIIGLDVLGLVRAAVQPMLGPLLQLTASTLAAASAPLDGLVDQLLAALGVQLGAADIRLDYVACGNARLVI